MATKTMVVRMNETRRTGFRRMGQMNGDFLTQLKNPHRRELSRSVQGYLGSQEAGMKKQIGLWFKEQNIVLNKVNKGQAKVYQTFLQVNNEQRRLQRLAIEKKRQRELKERLKRLDALNNETEKQNVTNLHEHMHVKDSDIDGVKQQETASSTAGQSLSSQNESSPEERQKPIMKEKYSVARSTFPVFGKGPDIDVLPIGMKDIETDKTLTMNTPNDVSTEVTAHRVDRKAKVLIVRKKSKEVSKIGEGGFVTERSGSLVMDGKGSFMLERSGSIYIQTVLTANDPVPEQPKGKKVESKKDASKTNKDSTSGPCMSLLTQDLARPPVDLRLTSVSEYTNVCEKRNKKPQLPNNKSAASPSVTPRIPVLEKSQNSPQKTEKNSSESRHLGPLSTLKSTKKPPPPTSYMLSVLGKEGEDTRRPLHLTRNIGRLPMPSQGPLDNRMSVGSYHRRSENSETRSIAEYNRRMRKRRAQQRKNILDKEKVVIYERDEQGAIISSGCEFKRKEFKRPSSRGERLRVALLKESKNLMLKERERVIQYIDKLSEQGTKLLLSLIMSTYIICLWLLPSYLHVCT